MAGIYGEFLGFFSELHKNYPLYERENKINNLELTKKGEVSGIVQSAGNTLEDKKTTMERSHIAFWTETKLNTKKDCLQIFGKFYAVIKEDYFSIEGGFSSYLLEYIQGAKEDETTKTGEITKGVF